MSNQIRLLLWNLEWGEPRACREAVRSTIADHHPNVICLVETTPFLNVDAAQVVTSTGDFGYDDHGGQKVWMWSDDAWTDVERIGSSELPPGRFVSAITHGIRFVGVCIPWFNAHVSDGNKNRKQWQDHVTYLSALRPILDHYLHEGQPLCVLGDFNQRVPPIPHNRDSYVHLRSTFEPEFTIQTAGLLDVDGEKLIDHVATTISLSFKIEKTIGRRTDEGKIVSDHPGLIGVLAQAN